MKTVRAIRLDTCFGCFSANHEILYNFKRIQETSNTIILSSKVYIITFTLTSFLPTTLQAFPVKIMVQDELIKKKVRAPNNPMLGSFCLKAHCYQFYFSDIIICILFPIPATLKASVKKGSVTFWFGHGLFSSIF